MMAAKVYAGMPTYDGTRWNAIALSDLRLAGAAIMEVSSSILAYGFNSCFAAALNARKMDQATHFLLLHADVIPRDGDWVARLIREMECVGAQVLSVMLPLKVEGSSLTSTALETSDPWRPQQLSLQEMQERPETWTHPNLLVNTGYMLIDIRKPWVEKICFTINDTIRQVNGRWTAEFEPEDWHFSRQCRALDIPVWVTRKFRALHAGRKYWLNAL
jgi:hypothetical protein